jgi:hypothetical protein
MITIIEAVLITTVVEEEKIGSGIILICEYYRPSFDTVPERVSKHPKRINLEIPHYSLPAKYMSDSIDTNETK